MGERKGPWRKANGGGSDSVTFRTALLSKLTPRAERAAANDAADLIADDVTIAFGGLLAIRNVNLRLARHEILGLIGPNGAGKTTLLHLAVGLLQPSAGSISVLGDTPASNPAVLSRMGFLAQDSPVYSRLSISDHLRAGAWLNPHWDAEFANSRINELGLDPRQRAGTLSGGQRAQLSLTMAVAKRPELLLLDEPVAALDPLARREFLQVLMEVAAVQSVSIVLSSHLISDLERVCDYLVVLVGGRIALSDDVDNILATHHLLTGPQRDHLPSGQQVIEESHVGRQSTFLIRTTDPIFDPSWTVTAVTLDDVVLAYMKQARDGSANTSAGLAVAS